MDLTFTVSDLNPEHNGGESIRTRGFDFYMLKKSAQKAARLVFSNGGRVRFEFGRRSMRVAIPPDEATAKSEPIYGCSDNPFRLLMQLESGQPEPPTQDGNMMLALAGEVIQALREGQLNRIHWEPAAKNAETFLKWISAYLQLQVPVDQRSPAVRPETSRNPEFESVCLAAYKRGKYKAFSEVIAELQAKIAEQLQKPSEMTATEESLALAAMKDDQNNDTGSGNFPSAEDDGLDVFDGKPEN